MFRFWMPLPPCLLNRFSFIFSFALDCRCQLVSQAYFPCSWLPLSPCLPNLFPFMLLLLAAALPPCLSSLFPFIISLLAVTAVLFFKAVYLHNFALGCRFVSHACFPSWFCLRMKASRERQQGQRTRFEGSSTSRQKVSSRTSSSNPNKTSSKAAPANRHPPACLSTMPASWAVMGSGPRREYLTARLHRTQRLPRPDWEVCSGWPTAPHPTANCMFHTMNFPYNSWVDIVLRKHNKY